MDNKSPRGELAASIAKAPDASFDIARKDANVIRSIVARAFRDPVLRPQIHFIEDQDDARLTLTMDIEAVHANGNPLNLEKLLDSDDFTFRHDISGIQGNVDRRSGRLRNFFTPRTSRRDDENRVARLAERPDNAAPGVQVNDGMGLKPAKEVAQEAKAASAKGAAGERAIPRKRSRPAAKRSTVATPAPRKAAKKVVGRARKVVGKATNRRRR